MTIVNGYCSAQQLRDHLKDDGAKLSEDLLERAVGAASRAIDLYCGRRFWLDSEPVARKYQPRDKTSVFIHDIGDLTGIVVQTDDTGSGTFGTTWSAGDYDLLPRNADADGVQGHSWSQIRALDTRDFLVHERRATLQITAKWGWSAVPAGIEEGCVLKAASLFKRKDAPFGVAGFGEFGVVRITRSDADVIELIGGNARLSRPDV